MTKRGEESSAIAESCWKENSPQSGSAFSMSRYMALLFAVASGMAVANIYYAQPLLDAMASELEIDHSTIGIIITVTQICYAVGLLLLVPLGDLWNQRKLIVCQMLLSVLALVVMPRVSRYCLRALLGLACLQS